jgi:hypothetical protein
MIDGPQISMKIHAAGDQLILAACDRDLLGKTLHSEEVEFKVSEHFYGGDLVNGETFLNMIGQITSANVVGNLCVDLLIENGIVDGSSIMNIDGIKHVQIYDLSDIR